MKQQLKNKIVSAILAYPPEAMTEAETQAEDIYRAVLKALETPTPAMLTAAGTMSNYDSEAEGASPDADHIEWWASMIKAAAQEQGDG